MSLVGTDILHPGSSSTANADQDAEQENGTQATPNSANAQDTETDPPTLTLQDLVNGTKNASVMTCEPWASTSTTYSPYSSTMGCESVDRGGTTLGALGYEGIKAHIQHMLFGGGPQAHVGLESDIISGTALSSAQMAFLRTMPGDMYTLLRQAQSSKPLVTEVLGLLEPVAVNQYAVQLGASLMATEQSVYSGNPHVVIPSFYKSSIDQIAQSENVYMRNSNTDTKRVLLAIKLLQAYHLSQSKDNGAP